MPLAQVLELFMQCADVGYKATYDTTYTITRTIILGYSTRILAYYSSKSTYCKTMIRAHISAILRPLYGPTVQPATTLQTWHFHHAACPPLQRPGPMLPSRGTLAHMTASGCTRIKSESNLEISATTRSMVPCDRASTLYGMWPAPVSSTCACFTLPMLSFCLRPMPLAYRL